MESPSPRGHREAFFQSLDDCRDIIRFLSRLSDTATEGSDANEMVSVERDDIEWLGEVRSASLSFLSQSDGGQESAPDSEGDDEPQTVAIDTVIQEVLDPLDKRLHRACHLYTQVLSGTGEDGIEEQQSPGFSLPGGSGGHMVGGASGTDDNLPSSSNPSVPRGSLPPAAFSGSIEASLEKLEHGPRPTSHLFDTESDSLWVSTVELRHICRKLQRTLELALWSVEQAEEA
jgi:hypothetical protein